jgi:hypothetical protein
MSLTILKPLSMSCGSYGTTKGDACPYGAVQTGVVVGCPRCGVTNRVYYINIVNWIGTAALHPYTYLDVLFEAFELPKT